jgi:phage FluMu gp28-like protein
MALQQINYTRPIMTDYQREIMDCSERFACIEASTKAGKTACMIVWLLEEALRCKANQSVFWVAPIFTQSKIAFDRMRNQITERSFFKVNESRLTLTLSHGSIIEFKSGDNPDSLYGNDCYAAVIDEASRMREEVWFAIRSTLTATNGKAKLIGNVKGRKNFFYKLAMKAKAKEEGFFYKRITAYDAVAAGILKQEEIDSAKHDLPDNVFKELYLAEASEDGSNPFGLNHITRAVFPLSSLPPVCFGIDLAKSTDWTVIIGLDVFGQICYYERFQKDWDQTEKIIISLPAFPMVIDSTGVGDAIHERVARSRSQTVEGFKFTQQSKQSIMEGLAAGIQKREVTVLDGIMKDELDSFEFEYTRTGVKYTAPSGMHDDTVCALALAYKNHHLYKSSGQISVW